MNLKTVEDFDRSVRVGNILVYQSDLTIYRLEFLRHDKDKSDWFIADHPRGEILRGHIARFPKICKRIGIARISQNPWYWKLVQICQCPTHVLFRRGCPSAIGKKCISIETKEPTMTLEECIEELDKQKELKLYHLNLSDEYIKLVWNLCILAGGHDHKQLYYNDDCFRNIHRVLGEKL